MIDRKTLVLAGLMFLVGFGTAGGGGTNPVSAAAAAQSEEIVFECKFFCSMKCRVGFPFSGTVTSIPAEIGNVVTNRQPLVRYRLHPEDRLQLRRRFASSRARELSLQLAEMERNVTALESRQREVRQLAERDLTPTQTVAQTEADLRILTRRTDALRDRLHREEQMETGERAQIRDLLMEDIDENHVPEEVSLGATLDGTVIWMNPELRAGALLYKDTPALVVGVMDPMVIRAQVYEMEAVRVRPGDRATVSLASLPGRTFDAEVSRISWIPLTSALDQPSYYEIELVAPNPDRVLKEGFRGVATVRVPRRPDTDQAPKEKRP